MTTLVNSFQVLKKNGYKTVFPVVAFSFPIWRSLKIEDGKVEMIWPEYKDVRSQKLPKTWHDAGQFYWLNVPEFLNEPSLYSSNTGSIQLSELEVQDIDNADDWALAELKAQFLK